MYATGIEEKQQYLRQNILDAGYDPQKFVEFCTKTHDLDDLQNWSMQQLVNIVQSFRFQQQQNSNKNKQYKVETPSLPVVEKVAAKVPLPQNKLAFNISDKDWTEFLSAPSLIAPTTTNLAATIPNNLFFNFELGNQADKIKDTPLSPPSNTSKKAASETPEPQRDLQKGSQIPKNIATIQVQKIQSKNPKQGLPINLSNLRIPTAKERLQPLLPQINDVVVTKTEQVSRNFLQGDYTLYHISFPPTQHVVKRKFSDLRKVRSLLQKFYPFLRLPYLQPEGWLSSSEGRDPETLQKYKLMVEQFIKYILLKSRELKDCQLVRILCGFSLNGLKDDLKTKVQALQNISRPKIIGEVILTENSILIPPVSSNDALIAKTLQIIGQIDINYERLRKQLQILFVAQQTLMRSYNQIALTFQTLQNLTKKYSVQNDEAKQVRIFDGFKEMVAKLSNQINRESQIFKKKIKNLFKYQKQNMATLKNKVHNQYQRQGCPPFHSNSMRMQGANVQVQSPVPLEQPSRNNKNTLALQQTFWSFVAAREISRYWEHLRKKITQSLTLIAYDELDGQNENLNFWNSMIKQCVL